MRCRECGQENPVGRLTCRACNTFLAEVDWESQPILNITESPLYHGLVGADECRLVQIFQGLCQQLTRGEINEERFAEELQNEVSRLDEFVEGIVRTLYPDGLSPEELPMAVEFVQLFRRSVDDFALAADRLLEGVPGRTFADGEAAARDAATVLAQAFNSGELALKSGRHSDGAV